MDIKNIINKIITTTLLLLAPMYLSFLFLPRLRYFLFFTIVLYFFAYRFINKIKKEIIFTSFIFFITFVSIDLFFYLSRTKNPKKIYFPDGTAIYKPNQNILTKYNEKFFGKKNDHIIEYKIDNNGYRNTIIPDTIYYIVIGDSYTFGLHVTQDSIWPTLLAKFTGKTVYNLGISNYNPEQYLQTFKNFLQQNHNNKIYYSLLMLYQGNDLIDISIEQWRQIDKSLQYPITYYKTLIGEKKKLSTIYTLYILNGMLKKKELIKVKTYTQHYTIITKKEFYDLEISKQQFLNHPNLENIKNSLIEFAAICNKNNIIPIVLIAPSKAVIYSKIHYQKEKKSNFIEYFKQFCNQNQIKCLDLTPFIKEKSNTQDLYYKLDNHWTSTGHLFIAKTITNYLYEIYERPHSRK